MVRKISNSNGKKYIGKFPSGQMGRSVDWESTIERDFIFLLEFDENVLSYEGQPFKIISKVNGKKRCYVPDFKVTHNNGDVDIVEVKPATLVEDYRTKLQVAIGTAYCQQQGYNFKLVTDEEIRKGYLLQNIKLLYRYSGEKVSDVQFNKVLTMVSKCGRLTFEELVKNLELNNSDTTNWAVIVYHLILTKNLVVELENEVLDQKSLIFWGGWDD